MAPSRVLEGKVVVESVNIVKKHTKPNPQKDVPGGIVEKEMPHPYIQRDAVQSVAKKGDRVGFRTLGGRPKVRFFKSNNEVVDA